MCNFAKTKDGKQIIACPTESIGESVVNMWGDEDVRKEIAKIVCKNCGTENRLFHEDYRLRCLNCHESL